MTIVPTEPEVCRICTGPHIVQSDENIPLCTGHWNAWLTRYLNFDYTGNEAAPCGAHLIRGAL